MKHVSLHAMPLGCEIAQKCHQGISSAIQHTHFLLLRYQWYQGDYMCIELYYSLHEVWSFQTRLNF